MRYGFDTDDVVEASAALLLYAVYRSRDVRRFKVTPDLWGQIERFTKSAAKRARDVPDFLERLKPKLLCETLHPRAMRVGLAGAPVAVRLASGAYAEPRPDPEAREFLTGVLRDVDQQAVVAALRDKTAWIVLLVRDRLERERPVEQRLSRLLELEEGAGDEDEDGDEDDDPVQGVQDNVDDDQREQEPKQEREREREREREPEREAP